MRKPFLLYTTYIDTLYNQFTVSDRRNDESSSHWAERTYKCRVVHYLNEPWLLEFDNEHDRLLFLLRFGGGTV